MSHHVKSDLPSSKKYEFNTSAGGYIFFLNLAIISTRAYVDKYLVTSLALFFLSANFG